VKDFGPKTFGELYADAYDDRLDMDQETSDSVAVLAGLAAGGRVLEFAIGTGRVALPLAATGLEVHGIETSEEMVAKLRAKPGGDAIPVTIGDMSEAGADGTFDLVFLVFNTILNLTSQEAQVRCLANAARHLNPGCVFVVETVLPELQGFVGTRAVRGMNAAKDFARFEVVEHDPLKQTLDYQRIIVTDEGTKLHPLAMRYIWPSELDLMARLAGLELRDRWAWWDKSPFTADSDQHVSVYAKP
jgi:SAM-dependent methyltransferase